MESNALTGMDVADGPRIVTDRSCKSSGSNKGSLEANTARSHTARSMRHDSPMSGNETDRGIKSTMTTPNRSQDNLAATVTSGIHTPMHRLATSSRLEPLPDIQQSIDLLNRNSINDLNLSLHQHNDTVGGGGGQGQGQGPPRNVLQQTIKGLDHEEVDVHNKTPLSLPNETTNNNMHHISQKPHNDLRRSSKQKHGNGYSEKVGLLHLLVVDDSGMSRKMLSRVIHPFMTLYTLYCLYYFMNKHRQL